MVESKWDSEKKTSKQKVLEYLGSVENLTIDNIPKDYRTGSIRKFFIKNQTKLNGEVVEKQKNLEMICLLYTSPSPRDQRGSRMPSSA